jgi:hypothetical protein
MQLGRTRRDLATVAPWTQSAAHDPSHSRMAQAPGRAPGRQLTPRTQRNRKDIFMVYGTRPVSLGSARRPRSSRLLGAIVAPGSHLSSQCPGRSHLPSVRGSQRAPTGMHSRSAPSTESGDDVELPIVPLLAVQCCPMPVQVVLVTATACMRLPRLERLLES